MAVAARHLHRHALRAVMHALKHLLGVGVGLLAVGYGGGLLCSVIEYGGLRLIVVAYIHGIVYFDVLV